MIDKTMEEIDGIITQALTEFGLSLGDVITVVFENGNLDHKKVLQKIFSDATAEVIRLLEKQ